jgi:Transposase DDE domain/Transposase domain (DUF772)
MTLGVADKQGDLFDDVVRFCDQALPESSIYSFLRRERDQLFADEAFGDLFEDIGRRSVPPSIVAVVMVLQRLEGLSDREATERYCFDARWRYAAGVGGYDSGPKSFVHTVLVDMRERLRNSERPDRIFEVALGAAKNAGLLSHKRALDSTPLYDAVATMDTVTLIRSAIRGLLKVADAELATQLREAMTSGDDYATSAKPMIDWDDKDAQAQLVDSRAKDAYACLLVLDGSEPGPVVTQAGTLLAAVVGQDLEEGADGVFRIVRGVAKDRVISTVDPQARHGHKTQSRKFDGFKGHIAIDPDSEIITATTVTAGNAGDASVAEVLIVDLLEDHGAAGNEAPTAAEAEFDKSAAFPSEESGVIDRAPAPPPAAEPVADSAPEHEPDRPAVYGDNAYGTGSFHERLEGAGIDSRCKTQDPTATGELFTKDRFAINLGTDTVTCPAGITVAIKRHRRGGGLAHFGDACASCPMQAQCTSSRAGRTISINAHEEALERARARQRDPRWREDYRGTRPKVERKIAHLMRRKHGGRNARVRGTKRIDDDFRLLAAAANLARLAVLGVRSRGATWAVAGA